MGDLFGKMGKLLNCVLPIMREYSTWAKGARENVKLDRLTDKRQGDVGRVVQY